MSFTLEYELTVDDVVHYNRHVYRHSDSLKAKRRQSRIGFAVLYMVLGIAALLFLSGIVWTVLGAWFIAIGLLWYLGYERLELWYVGKTARRMLSDGSNAGMIGKQNITIEGSRFTEKNERATIHYDAPFIDKVSVDDTFIYCFISSIQAILVPREALPEGMNVDAFLNMIEPFIRTEYSPC